MAARITAALTLRDQPAPGRVVVRYTIPGGTVEITSPPDAAADLMALWARLEAPEHEAAFRTLEPLWAKALGAVLAAEPRVAANDAAACSVDFLRRLSLRALGDAVRAAFRTLDTNACRPLLSVGLEPYPETEWFEVPGTRDGVAARVLESSEVRINPESFQPLDPPRRFATADRRVYTVTGNGAVTGAFGGIRCRVRRAGVLLRGGADGEDVPILACEVVTFRAAPPTEMDRLLVDIVELAPDLGARLHVDALADRSDAAKLAAAAATLGEAWNNPSLPEKELSVCQEKIKAYAHRQGWELLQGDAGFRRAAHEGYTRFRARLAPRPADAPGPEVVLESRADTVFVIAPHDEVAAAPPEPTVLVRTGLAPHVQTWAPDLAAPLAAARMEMLIRREEAEWAAARQALLENVLALRERLWAGGAEKKGDRIAAQQAFAAACREWLGYECLTDGDSARADLWQVRASRAYAPAGGATTQVLLPALVSVEGEAAVVRGELRTWRPRPPWLGALLDLGAAWPWGELDAEQAADGFAGVPAPWGERLALLLQEDVDPTAAAAAADAILDAVDERQAATAFRDWVIEWARRNATANLPPAADYLRGTIRLDAIALTEQPGEAAPSVAGYVRFAEPRVEIAYGRDSLADAAADAPAVMRALVCDQLVPLPAEWLSEAAAEIARLPLESRAALADALHFEARLPWRLVTRDGWAYGEIDPAVLALYDLPDGAPASLEKVRVTFGAEAEPTMGGAPAMVRGAAGGEVVMRGEWRDVMLPLPRATGRPGDVLQRLRAVAAACEVAELGKCCESVAGEIEDLAWRVVTGVLEPEAYPRAVFRAYRESTQSLPPPVAAEHVEEVRHAVGEYVGAKVTPPLAAAANSAAVLAGGRAVELADAPPGELLRIDHPLGGVTLDGEPPYELDDVYAICGPLLRIAAGRAADAQAALAALGEGDPTPMATLLSLLREAGADGESLAAAEADLGFGRVLAEPLPATADSVAEGVPVRWTYGEAEPGAVLAIDPGLVYSGRVLRAAAVTASRGKEPHRLRELLAADDIWSERAAPWRNELVQTVERVADPEVGIGGRGKLSGLVLRALDNLWQTELQGAGDAAPTRRALGRAATEDDLLETAGAVDASDVDCRDAPPDGVLWREPRVDANVETVRCRMTQFGVSAPAALAREAQYVPVLPDSAFGRALAGCLKAGMASEVAQPLMQASDSLAALVALVRDHGSAAHVECLAELAASLGVTLAPAAAVKRQPPAALSREEFNDLHQLGDARIAYLLDEERDDVFRLADVSAFGLRRGGEWLLEPRVVLETSHLPLWARVARCCEKLLAEREGREAFRQGWSELLGDRGDAAQALRKVLESASAAWRRELLRGEAERGVTVYQRLLPAADYQQRYAAFTRALEELGMPAEKMLYRSQLVRRLVHVDAAAPSNESPVLWALELGGGGKAVVLRFASAVRSR